MLPGGRRGCPLLCEAMLAEDDKTGSGCFRQLDEAEDAETEVANVDTERIL